MNKRHAVSAKIRLLGIFFAEMALRFCRHFQSLSCSFQRLKLINKKTWFARKNHISAQDAREISVPLPYGSIAGMKTLPQ